MKQFIEAGEFVTTHGVLGELKLYPWCDSAAFAAALPRLYFTPQGGQETKVEAARVHKGMCLGRLHGVNSLDAARAYIRKVAYFNRADVTLPEGRWFVQDIIGCKVLDADTGTEYGVITAIDHPAASDIYTVQNSAGETFLFPAVPEFLVQLAPERGEVAVRPIPGMFTNGGGSEDAH